MLISEGYVGLNNEICTQKRKKVFSGDVIAFDGELYQLALAEGATPIERPAQNTSQELPPIQQEPQRTSHKQKSSKKKKNKDSKTGRRPISFG